MADILIRGMEMPKGCAECKLNSDTICVLINGCIYDESNGSNRRPDCPLHELPEHGDLIDRDAFRAENEYYLNREFINPKYEDTLEDLLKDAPVVIPSNKEETE